MKKFLLALFIFGIFAIKLIAQDTTSNFTAVNWTTAKSQQFAVNEAQGRVVNGKLYTFGGFDSRKPGLLPTKRAYVYNPQTNTWAAIAALPYTPNGSNFGGVTHAGIATDGTDIYLAGGVTADSAGTGSIEGTKQVWKYIISQNTYIRLPDLPAAIGSGQMEYLNGELHYFGGFTLDREMDLATHYVLNLNNLTAGWQTRAPMPNPRQHAGSVVFGGKIYSIGGQIGEDDTLITQRDLNVYDPATDAWTRLADLPVPAGATGRGHISSAVVISGQRFIVIGGETVHIKGRTNMVSAYSPATDTWQNLTPLPAARFSGVAAVLNGKIYYTGGSLSNVTYKGTPVAPALSPSSYDTLSPVADAYVRDGSYAGVNYGSDTTLAVKRSLSAGYTRFSYLKFSLNNISNIASAKLRLYGRNIDNASFIKISSYGVNNDSWTESGITWKNAPAASTAALGLVSVGNEVKYYEFDVTDYVRTQLGGDKTVTLLIKDSLIQNKNIAFNSKENTFGKPQLVLTSASDATTNTVSRSIKNTFINDTNFKKPLIYPNPFRKSFSVKFPADYKGTFLLEIIDQAGRSYNLGKTIVQSGGADLSIDISKFKLQPGIYFLNITADKTKAGATNKNDLPVLLEIYIR